MGMRAAPHLMSIHWPMWGFPGQQAGHPKVTGKGRQDTRRDCVTARTPRSPSIQGIPDLTWR
jgi:hypothetical protein